MTQPTTAECIAIIDLMLEQMKDANIEKGSEAERTLQTIRSIRAKLLAAQEMAKVLRKKLICVDYCQCAERKAINAYREAGGQ